MTDPLRANVCLSNAARVTRRCFAGTTMKDCRNCAGAKNSLSFPSSSFVFRLSFFSSPVCLSSADCSAMMWTASLRLISPSRCTFIFIVAEHITVVLLVGNLGMNFSCVFGNLSAFSLCASSFCTMALISSSKPNSINRSPSSSTSQRTLLTSSAFVFSK